MYRLRGDVLSMVFEFTDKAMGFISKEQIDSIYIKMSTVSSWSVHFRPLVKKGKPEFPEAFEKYKQEGLNIFYDYALAPKEVFLIGYQKIGSYELLVPGEDRL